MVGEVELHAVGCVEQHRTALRVESMGAAVVDEGVCPPREDPQQSLDRSGFPA
jgi:hypothetical protein